MTTIAITGAAGNIGSRLTRALAAEPDVTVVAADVRPPVASPGVVTATLDIRDPAMAELLATHDVDVLVHLAAVLSPPQGMTPAQLHDIEVGGTRNVLEACLAAGVKRFVYTSSGAAYGYSPDNAALLFEDAPLRGHDSFPYAEHKRQIEELLADFRERRPELGQLIFRVSTILGRHVHSPITRLFERPVVLGLRGADTPFCFAWDADVVECLRLGSLGAQTGTYNLTGDGAMTLREVAAVMSRRYLALPERLLRTAIGLAHERGWTDNTPEQIAFLKHRPVLANRALRQEFGFVPSKTSREALAAYRSSRV